MEKLDSGWGLFGAWHCGWSRVVKPNVFLLTIIYVTYSVHRLAHFVSLFKTISLKFVCLEFCFFKGYWYCDFKSLMCSLEIIVKIFKSIHKGKNHLQFLQPEIITIKTHLLLVIIYDGTYLMSWYIPLLSLLSAFWFANPLLVFKKKNVNHFSINSYSKFLLYVHSYMCRPCIKSALWACTLLPHGNMDKKVYLFVALLYFTIMLWQHLLSLLQGLNWVISNFLVL